MSGLLAVEASNVVFPSVKWEVLLTGTQLWVWSVCMQCYRKLSENGKVQAHWDACAHVCSHVNAHTNTEIHICARTSTRARTKTQTHIFRKWKRANEREVHLGICGGGRKLSNGTNSTDLIRWPNINCVNFKGKKYMIKWKKSFHPLGVHRIKFMFMLRCDYTCAWTRYVENFKFTFSLCV